MQNRFWLYVGNQYYPTQAGQSDFKSAHPTQESAIEAGRLLLTEGYWWQVVEITDEGPKFLSNAYQSYDKDPDEELVL